MKGKIMSGRILLVDTVATNRIVLKVKLLAALYDVRTCDSTAEARDVLEEFAPDLIILTLGQDDGEAADFCSDVKADPATAHLPIIATGAFSHSKTRLQALQAGADDVLARPIDDLLLLARIRSLLRARDAAAELHLRKETSRALGFAEPAEGFTPSCSITLISNDKFQTPSLVEALKNIPGVAVNLFDTNSVVSTGISDSDGLASHPDLVVLAASQDIGAGVKDLFRQVADLRARADTRHAGLLILLPNGSSELAAMLLDLGANDLVTCLIDTAELELRVKALLRSKLLLDRLRETVRCGLEAAVTDPLTGLYNRRYALSHLKGMAERAADSGRDFAVMMLDVDHFKKINDRFGHATGDQVLCELAERLRDNLRAVDLIARIGGEEFLVAMPDTSAEQARGAAERLRRIIKNQPFAKDAKRGAIAMTLSIGVAMGGTNSQIQDDISVLFKRADTALYAAKTAGRNMVNVCQSAA